MPSKSRDLLLTLLALAAGVLVLLLSGGWGLDDHGRRLLATFAATDFRGQGGPSMNAALRMALEGFSGLVPITIVAGTAFAAVVRSTGLAERIVLVIMKLVAGRSGAATPARVLGAFYLADIPASIMIPSAVGRCAMYLALVDGFAKPFRFARVDGTKPVNPFQKAVWITVSLITLIMGGAFLTGAALTIMVGGIIEDGTGVPQYWLTSFALLGLPALVMMAASWFILLRLFPSTVERIDASFINEELARLGRPSYGEKYCMATFVVMVAMFLTDAVHHVPAPMVLVLASLALFFPGVGPGDWKTDGKHVGWDGFFIIGVALGFSTMLTRFQVTDFLAGKIAVLSVGGFVPSMLAMIAATMLIRLGLASITASAALIVPVALALGKTAGLGTSEIVGLCWVTYIFCRLSFFLPHQSVEMLMSYGYGGYTKNDLIRAASCITVVALAVYILWAVAGMPRVLAVLN